MRVTKIHGADQRITGVTTTDSAGNYETFDVDHVLSSMPIKELFGILEVPAPAEAIRAADDLRYRDFLTVALIIRKANLFPDNWIYIHSPKVKVGRIQNFGNWSPYLVPDEGHSCLGLEYFVQEGDEEWTSTDAELIEQGKREAALLGLIDSADVLDGVVIRMPKAYPVYDKGYKDRLQVIQRFIDSIENLQFIGRNGQHRYNNQDHSMMTAFFAAENVLGAQHDVWNVNVDGEYHEVDEKKSVSTSGDRMVPESATRSPAGIFASAFAKYDPVALGAALGSISGIAVFLATAALLLRGGENVGRTLSLLANYLIGFEVTWVGAVIGLLWATGGGFAIGACMAFAINLTVSRHLAKLYRSLGVVVTPE
jgi:hypothetical protein